MARKLLPLAFVLALVAAACAEPPDPEIEFGSGRRFVPMVADSLNDVGRFADVFLDQDGRAIVAYFAFEERTAEGVLPQTRPVGAPTVPGVLMATMSEEGIWTRGAMALEAQIPNVSVPFNPGFDASIAELTARTVTGLDVVVDGDTFHAVWGSADGAFYATGSADPNATEQVRISKVTDTVPVGPSIAVVGGSPRIAYYTSSSSSAAVELARPEGDRWSIEGVSSAASCATCQTAVIDIPDGLAVAFTGENSVWVATNDGENGWASRDVEQGGGEGLSGMATGDGLALAYYLGDEVHVATGTADGPFDTASVETVDGESAAKEDASTSIGVDDAGTTWVAWTDATEGVGFASGDGETFEIIDTGASTATGAMPSVAVSPDGATAYLAWYDTEHQDVLLGAYGEIEGLAVAEPSPEPTGGPAPPPTAGECTEPVDGVVEITARGIAFDTPCVEVPAGEPFTIAFDNEDSALHNVAIYPNADDLGDPLFQGEVFTGPDSREYPPVDPLDAGEYFFQCDVHPDIMTGTVRVTEGGGGGGGGTDGGGGGGAGALTVTAQNIAFDTDTIALAASQETTFTFVNNDPDQHNVAIYPSADEVSPDAALFQGEIFPGPDERQYSIPPIEAGEYYFQCDVHPTIMTGTVTVE
ncbi:MAG: cupredoxin domain-containing protein [Actinomycetota bacterium]